MRDRGTLVLIKGAKEEALPIAQADLKRTKPLRLMSVVYAQSTPSIIDISRALASDDPIIRRNAPDALAREGTRAIPYINSALTSKDTSYRTKLGVITAVALDKTPLAAWGEGVAKRKQPLRYPVSAEEFFLDFLPAVPRTIQRDGIHFHKLRYWDSVLSPWASRLKESLWVKYDPRNLSRVYVRDPDGKHWPVPYADLRQPPIALWELTEARKRLRQHGSDDPTERALFANILEQRRIMKEAASRSHQRRRKERVPSEATVQPTVQEPAPGPAKQSDDLKPYPVEIWEQE